jgi:hypothetical protein
MVAKRACKGVNAKGEPCKSPPLHESEFCVFHDPSNAEAMQEARRLGGMRRKREATVAVAYDFEGLESISQIRRLVEVAANDTLGQENSLGRSRTLGYLAQIAASLHEKGELADQVAAIEAAVGPRVISPTKRR